MKIKGNCFVVTGGASGLGEAVVRRIVADGGFAVIFDMQEQSGKALETEFEGKVLNCKVDVTSESKPLSEVFFPISAPLTALSCVLLFPLAQSPSPRGSRLP